ncbi:uncharacterized protein SPAPADRAFT_154438 [Spathaspora passalidarum NRRL Y-27907]|uniref:RRM domain-containing protein n=1 Tax=Spathaspora passalidarum (strain NRRL Y-27907 / 11-Y1) TaxID=619300 RepID=G3ARW1_SPAPN|nr:uncharacterized protein SPAPADRAFT_154438 [Spathaspora passalidarum NRRL Y-27907]EGW31378.1 hypothetical protein SPAPADRAFT_154438 [Spathaspora passalidarum NRRL Y-27907]
MSNIDDDEALFEDLYGDDDETSTKPQVNDVPVATESAKADEKEASNTTTATTKTGDQQQASSAVAAAPAPAAPAAIPPQMDPAQYQQYLQYQQYYQQQQQQQQQGVSPIPGQSFPQAFPGMPPVPPPPVGASSGTPPAPGAGAAAGAPPPIPPPPAAPPVQHQPSNVGRDSGKMFVGGLNWDTTEEGLRDYFSKYGNVLDYTIMRDSATGRSRGFGFLTFEDPKSVDEVIKVDHILDGKLIDPKRAIAREEQDRVGKIFVGGIDPLVTEKEFYDFFAQYGSIIDAQLMVDKDTGRSRGFGFITYDSPDAVDRVTVNKYLSLKGRAMEVKRAEPRGQHQQNVMQQRQQQQQSSYYGAGAYGSPYGAGGAQMYQQQMNPAMNQEYMRYYQWFMYQQMAAGGAAAGTPDASADQQPAGQPLNPQQQANDTQPTEDQDPQEQNHDQMEENHQDYRGGYEDENPHRDQRRLNLPKGPKRAPPSGPGYNSRGRGGYHRRSRGYHPYSRGGGRR